jgi:predicted nuclease with TOPRIM domain
MKRTRCGESAVQQGAIIQDLGLWPQSGFGRDARFMTNEERIAKLEAQINKLQAKQAELHKQLTKAQIDQWQGRLEDLEVQMHLGAMETNDKLTVLMDQLRNRWADARRQLEDTISTASNVADTVRTGLENAFNDVRKALLESKSKLT